MLLVSLALGVGSGSVLAGYASEKKVEIGLVPIAALGLIFFSALLGCVQHSVPLIALLIFLDGICGGAFVVPLFAYIQRWSPSQSRGRYLAATNFMSFNGVLLASALIWLFRDILSVSAFSLFFLMSLMVFVVMIFMYIKLPDAYIRCFNWIFVHVFYWRKVIESARIPEEGGALLVSNYTSYLDPVIIMASIERPIRFLISREFCDSGKLNRYARAVNAISTSLSDTPEQLNQTLESVEKAIKNGELVCVFAKTNETVLIKLCIERLTQVPNVPIVPLYIDKARGSLFNRQDGKYSMKFPARIPYPVTIYFGEVLASGSDEAQVKAVMLQLSGEALKYRR
jgi:acyl-[acyl-carrier-protein]-phospholipid O-acyltransferase/long-chain-fatty-acid--[acyl-carrier-protein] ligase